MSADLPRGLHRLIRPPTPAIAGLFLFLAVGTAAPQEPAVSKPSEPRPTEPAVPILVGPTASLDELLGRLKMPDFVLLRGERYRELLKALDKEPARADEPIVEGVTIRGRVDRLSAEVEVEFRVASTSPAARWVPIRLDGLVLTSATDGEKTVPLRAGGTSGWEAEVRGAGEHAIRVGFAARVAAVGEERRLDFAIPVAATNTLRLTLAGEAADVSVGPGEPVAIGGAGVEGVRIDAALRPRARVELRWRVPTERAGTLPPLLTAQGDVAVDVTADAIRTRSRWSVTSARGAASALTIAYDAEEELVELDLDGRPVAIEGDPLGDDSTVTIPLSEPLRPGGPARSMTVVTRRRISSTPSARVAIRGAVPGGATILGGALAVSQAGPIWVEGEGARGLQRIDPASDLPSDLRSRPGTVLAYRIVDRPFELNLRVEPALPRVEARAGSTVVLLPGSAATETRFAVRTTPARVFDLHFPVPDGVEVEPPAAGDVVESSNLAVPPGGGPRVLAVRLTPRARASGSFALTLATRQSWPESGGDLRNALPWPSEAESLGGRVAVVAAPGVEVRLGTGGSFSRLFAATDDDWPWPASRPAEADSAPLRLAYEGHPDVLHLTLEVRPPSYRSETDLVAEIGRDGVAYSESIRLEVLGGRIDGFDLLVPAGVDRGWTIEGLDVASRTPVAVFSDGSSRYPITLTRKGAARVAFDLRYTVPYDRPLTAGAGPTRSGRFARIRTLPAAPGPVRLSYRTTPGVSAEVSAPGWREGLASMPSAAALERTEPSEMPAFEAKAEPLLAMPGLIVSRAFLRSVRGPDEVRTTAIFRFESAEPSVELALPAGSRWVRGRLDGVDLRNVELLDAPDRYRFRAPPGGPRTLAVDYAGPIARSSAWQPAALVGSVTESAYWEVVVGGDRAVLGTPAGWSDENRWRWTKYIWMKTPLRSEDDLLVWAAGAAAPSVGEASSAPTSLHAYLFRKADGLGPLPVSVVSRSALVVACSGAVALAGIGLVVIGAAARPYAALAIAVIVLAASAWDPDLALQAIPSGALGLLLTAVAAALQWITGRRRTAAARGRFAGSSGQAPTAAPSTSASVIPAVGSDDSTSIRPRPAPPTSASADRFVISPGAGPPEPSPSISGLGIGP